MIVLFHRLKDSADEVVLTGKQKLGHIRRNNKGKWQYISIEGEPHVPEYTSLNALKDDLISKLEDESWRL